MSQRTVGRESARAVEMPVPLPARFALGGLAAEVEWPDLCRDLVEVAYSVLLADRLVLRPRGTLGPRRISLRLAVRAPRAWRRAAPELEHVLSILGGDAFTFDFHGRADGGSGFPRGAGRRGSPPPRVEGVALFSGGLDSAAAAADFAAGGRPVAYVTHYVKGVSHVRSLLSDIHGAYGGGGPPPHALFYIRPEGDLTRRLKENSRRSRAFLFVSLALATAVALGAPEVRVCENGPLALNLPLTPAMVPTRHAHGSFLRAMERLCARLFGAAPRVLNPYELRTKGEMCAVFAPHPGLALATASCWNQQWSGRGRRYGKGHCGFCLPCLVRLASLRAAGIVIPRGHFDTDVLRLARRPRPGPEDARRLGPLRALLSFEGRLLACGSWRRFLQEFPEVTEAEPTARETGPDEWFRDPFGMMRRFGSEVGRSFPGG